VTLKGLGIKRTHCNRGHELTEANTWTRPSDGHRYCRTCQKVAPSRKKRSTREAPTCKQGHPRTPENTRVGANGSKYCLVCHPPRPSSNKASTTCRYGHPRTPQTTLVGRNGKHYCQVCMFENRRLVRIAKRNQHDESRPDVATLVEQQAQGPQAMLREYLKSQGDKKY